MANYPNATSQAGAVNADAGEWTTVVYKKPVSPIKKAGWARRRRGGYNGERRGAIVAIPTGDSRRAEQKQKQKPKPSPPSPASNPPRTPTYASVAKGGPRTPPPTNPAFNSDLLEGAPASGTVAKKRRWIKTNPMVNVSGDSCHDQDQQSRSPENGSLPGWYSPPAWDVTPVKRGPNARK